METVKHLLVNQLQDNCFETLVDIYTNEIETEEAGILTENNCTSQVLSILLHCTRNIEIFNTDQKNNIGNFINMIRYAQG